MPAAGPAEFRPRSLSLVAQGNPVGQVAEELGIGESRLRRWMSTDKVGGFPVAVTCQVLGVAPSTYYKLIKRQPSTREGEDQALSGLIVEVRQDSRGT